MEKSRGQRILERLKSRGMTAKELAGKAGSTETSISRYINDERVPKADVLSRIAAALDTTMDYLERGSPQNCEDSMRDDYREIAFNGSGYFDETPYKVLRKYKEDKEEMSDAMSGDIWTTYKGNGDLQEVLILAMHGNYASILTLMDKEPFDNPVTVHSRSSMYADAGRVSYIYVDKLVDIVKSLKVEEFTKIMRKVIETLTVDMPEPIELPEAIPAAHQPTPPTPVITEAELANSVIISAEADTGALDELKEQYRALEIKQAETAAERDIYKELFYKAFPQMGGA